MKKQVFKIIAFSYLLATVSCSPELRPFTSNVLQEGGWSDNDLQKIQFYFAEEESAWASLLVDLKKIQKIEVQSRTERGRKVN